MTKEELRDFRKRAARQKDIDGRRQEIRAKMEKLTAKYGSEAGGGGKAGDRIGEYLDNLKRLDEIYAGLEAELAAKKVKIEIAMAAARLNPSEAEAVRRYYFDYRKWEQVAASMRYSIDGVFRLHGNALKKLARLPE